MTTQITRRDLGTTAGSIALGLAASPTATAQAPQLAQPSAPRFPDGFYWVLPRAPELNRRRMEGGRERSLDLGHVRAHARKDKNVENGDVADNHYHRYKEDVR